MLSFNGNITLRNWKVKGLQKQSNHLITARTSVSVISAIRVKNIDILPVSALGWLPIGWRISRELQHWWGNRNAIRTCSGHRRRTFHDTSRPSNTTNEPCCSPTPSKRPMKAAGNSMESTSLPPTPKVSAKKVKDGQTKRKFKKRHCTKTFQLDINDKGCWVSKSVFTIRFDGALLTPATGRGTDVFLHLFGMFPVVDLPW